MTVYANSAAGKALGTNEGDKSFPVQLGGSLAGPGIWLNTVTDAEKPGFYWVKFNAALPISKLHISQIYAKNGTGKWAMYKYNGTFDNTMAGTPVATDTINQAKDGSYSITFATPLAAGQYVFYIEQDMVADTYFNIGTTGAAYDEKKFEFGYNGTPFSSPANEMISGSIEFVGSSASPFADIVADSAVNPQTGSVSLIGLAVIPLISVLVKKRKV